jgi:L-phenylalanine/L-methionine N-acetyltransferase
MTRKINPSDFDFIYELYMHPAVNPYLLYEIMSKEDFRPIYNDLLAQNIIYIFSENGQDFGMFKLIPLAHRTSHINYLGGLAIHPKYSGNGYGQKMFLEIIEICRQKNIKRIELSVATTNLKAIKLYEKMGFKPEGILQKYTYLKSENRFLDEQYMAYLFE